MPEVPASQFRTTQPPWPILRKAVYGKYFAYGFSWEPLAASATQARRSVTIGGWEYLLMRLAFLYDRGGAKLQMESTPAGLRGSTVPWFLSGSGSGKLPIVLDPGYLLRIGSVLTWIADDRGSAALDNNIYLACHGLKLQKTPVMLPRRYEQADAYIHVANFTADDAGPGAVGANATTSFSNQIEAESDFEIKKITMVSDGTFTLQITTHEEDWFDTPLRSELLGGSVIEGPLYASGEFPFILPQPRMVQGGSYILTRVTDTLGAANRIQIFYYGTRLYPKGGRP